MIIIMVFLSSSYYVHRFRLFVSFDRMTKYFTNIIIF